MESITIANLILTIINLLILTSFIVYTLTKKEETKVESMVVEDKKIKKVKPSKVTLFNGETDEEKERRLYLEKLPKEAQDMSRGKTLEYLKEQIAKIKNG